MKFLKLNKKIILLFSLLLFSTQPFNTSYAQDKSETEKVIEKPVEKVKTTPVAPVTVKKEKVKDAAKETDKSPYALKPGKVYYKVHTVKAHENLYKIARKYGLGYKTLASMNNAKTPYLNIGQKVIIGKSVEPVGNMDGVIVNIPEKKLYYFNDGKIVKTFGVAVGSPSLQWQTPVGDFKIVSKIKDPIWKIPLSIQKEMKENGQEVKKEIPAGPGNPLGKWWMGLTWTGLGIHSTTAPYSIGYSVSHGCIRMKSKTAEELFKLVKTNTPVKLAYQTVLISMDANKKVYLEVHKNIYGKKLDTVAKAKEMLVHFKLDKNIDWDKVKQAAIQKSGKPVSISKI